MIKNIKLDHLGEPNATIFRDVQKDAKKLIEISVANASRKRGRPPKEEAPEEIKQKCFELLKKCESGIPPPSELVTLIRLCMGMPQFEEKPKLLKEQRRALKEEVKSLNKGYLFIDDKRWPGSKKAHEILSYLISDPNLDRDKVEKISERTVYRWRKSKEYREEFLRLISEKISKYLKS